MIGNYEIMSKDQLQKSLDKLVGNQLLVKKNAGTVKYLVNDPNLYKIKRLLRD
jgi:hypothetical protein